MAASRSPRRRESQLAFEALSIEGGLLSPEWLSRVGQLSAGAQGEADYRVPKGLNLRDEIGRYWRIAQAHWREFDAGRVAGASARILAERFVPALLSDSFGFDSLAMSGQVTVTDRMYPIGFSALGGRVPVVIAPAGSGVDSLASSFGDGGRRRSAFGLAQEFLNASADATWGLVSDGLTLRIVRDNASLTRPAWIEADLERIFTEGRYADFAALWLLAHETRFGKSGESAVDGALELWRVAGHEEGTRAREHLRKSVKDALVALGQGFLSHPENSSISSALQDGSLTKMDYFQQLLRLVYRIIFLLTVEERGLLHPEPSSDAARSLYGQGYALKRLRDRSVKRSAHDRFSDLWEALKIVFRGAANGEPRLALPALAGLFSATQCPLLDASKLENHALLLAVFHLSWLREPSGLSRVNWRDMGPEELGSVYEGLLELQPQVSEGGRAFGFATGGEAKGNARKTSGSYYTPDSLVQLLLDSALEPVVQSTIAAHPEKPVQALLDLSIVDPACGSGHFLLAAARRLAAHVARLQANGTPSARDYRHALRQVVGRCIYGVDKNAMAVELCKVSLWMEAVEPGLPLTFLNSHIQQGNALLGATPALMETGVPDAAWDPIEGDDKKIAAALKRRNKQAAAGQRGLSSVWSEPGDSEPALVAHAIAALEAAPDSDVDALGRKESEWDGILKSEAYRHQVLVANAWCAALVWPKQSGPLAEAAPTNELWRQIRDGEGRGPALTVNTTVDLATQYDFFHWHLAFPQVFARGGFDVVLGNPPWERVKVQAAEWFAQRRPEIAMAPNAAARKGLIARLAIDDPEQLAAFRTAIRFSEGESAFFRGSGRYPLCGRGDINSYAVFAETFYRIAGPASSCGLIVPSGILADETTKLFFKELQETATLAQAVDFENNETLFPGVGHGRMRFCLLTIRKGFRTEAAKLFFLARGVADLTDQSRWFELGQGDAAAINPNSGTCPVFLSQRDAEIARSAYRRFSVLRQESTGASAWGARLHRVFDMTTDSPVLKTAQSLSTEGWVRKGAEFRRGSETMLPIIEGKTVTFYDHRAAHIRLNPSAPTRQQQAEDTSEIEKQTPDFSPEAYLWAPKDEAQTRFHECVRQDWAIAFKRVTSATNWRTMVACVVPDTVAVSYTLYLIGVGEAARTSQHCLLAILNSFAYDYFVRQKTMQPSLPIGPVYETLVPSPTSFDAPAPWSGATPLTQWIADRVVELTCVSGDLVQFGRTVLGRAVVFRWMPERRDILRAELDAMAFYHFGLSRAEVEHVFSTFPKVRSQDEKRYGEYRTKRVILEIYDAFVESAATGRPYLTRLDPAPADSHMVHPGQELLSRIEGLPAVVPKMRLEEEAALSVCAILHANGGSIPRMDLARAFALRSQPGILAKLAGLALGEMARMWADKVRERRVTPGLLAGVLKALAERDGLHFVTDGSSRSMVATSRHTPPEDQIDLWFQFEARLALQVLASLPAHEVLAVDAGITGDDRRLLEEGVA
jgi:hypothetical protein